MAGSNESKSILPRKTAVVPYSSRSSGGLDKGNEEHEEVHHSDGKVWKFFPFFTRDNQLVFIRLK